MATARHRPQAGAPVAALLCAALAAICAAVACGVVATAVRADPAGPPAAARPAPPASSAGTRLSAGERAAQAVLAAQRTALLKRYAAHPERLFAAPFERVRPRLETSAVYRSLRRMPKGGLLHIHATGTGDAEWIVDRALSEPACYVFWGPTTDDHVHGQLAVYPEGGAPAGFVRLADLARTRPRLRAALIDLFTLGAEDKGVADIWREFELMFRRIDGFASYVPVFRGYYRDAFLGMAEDGVRFVELRTGLDPLVAADGSLVEDEAILAEYRSILTSVRRRHPGFDLRIIVCTWRGATLEQAAAQLARERALAAAAPDLVEGFDVIAEEDTGHSNGFYAPVLTTEPRVPLYLHAGESGSPQNHNVREALDLGARRIGHGLNMDLFAGLEDDVREAGVTVEVCPLSNQALRYVTDLRDHPARGWLRRGLKAVLGSDDPALFQSHSLSDDLTLAYLAWGLDLATLKEMAEESIAASSLPGRAKARQRDAFGRAWRTWVAQLASSAAR